MIVNRESLAGITTGFTALFNNAFSATESHLDKIATVLTSISAEEVHGWIGNFPGMREWVGDRHIGNPEAFSYNIKNRTFESTFAVSREDIEDDKIGMYSPTATQIGELAKTHPDELLFELLKNGFAQRCYDGQYFFDTDHSEFVNLSFAEPIRRASGVNTFLLGAIGFLHRLCCYRRFI